MRWHTSTVFLLRHSGSNIGSEFHSRRGTSAVQFAVVAPIMFFIFMGMVELGRAIMVTELLTNAAHVGCRTGVIEGKSTDDIKTAVNTFLPTVGIQGDNVSVTVNDGAADASSANANDDITVTVSIPVGNVTWLPGGSHLSGNLTGRFTLRRE